MTEVWRDIPGWEGYYSVSTEGRVKSLARTIYRPNAHRLPERILAPRVTRPSGHLRVGLYRDAAIQSAYIHRLVLMTFVGPPPEGMQGCHGDGDPTNNRLSNLRWGTASDNAQDRLRHGVNPFANRTHCKWGHEFTPENTYHSSKQRQCRTCNRLRQAERAAKKKLVVTALRT